MSDAVADWLGTLRAARARSVPGAIWEAVTAEIWPQARLEAVEPLVGGLGGLLDRVRATDRSGAAVSVVVRRFMPEWGENGEHVQGEAATLEVLAAHDLPAPRLRWTDPEGRTFGRPALAMTDLPGRALATTLDPEGARLAGRLLARLHRIPGAAMTHRPASGDLAAQIERILERSRPQPEDVVDRDAVHAALTAAVDAVPGQPETFLHDDYHPGNIIRHGADARVIDLTWSTRGDPGRDLGYCRLDLCLTGVAGSTDAFLDGYRAGGGVVPEHLWTYDLLAALRCLPSPAQWLPAFHEHGRSDLTAAQVEARVGDFVERGLIRATRALGTLDGDDVRSGSNG